MMDPSQTVGPPTERTLENIRRATMPGCRVGRVSLVWTWRTGQWFWTPDVEDVTGPWWEKKDVLTVRSLRVYWLCLGVAVYWPVVSPFEPPLRQSSGQAEERNDHG